MGWNASSRSNHNNNNNDNKRKEIYPYYCRKRARILQLYGDVLSLPRNGKSILDAKRKFSNIVRLLARTLFANFLVKLLWGRQFLDLRFHSAYVLCVQSLATLFTFFVVAYEHIQRGRIEFYKFMAARITIAFFSCCSAMRLHHAHEHARGANKAYNGGYQHHRKKHYMYIQMLWLRAKCRKKKMSQTFSKQQNQY